MSQEKNLLVNCVICDARNVNEEELKEFEEILINTDFLLVDKRSKVIINHLPIKWNIEHMLQLEEKEEIKLMSYNGKYEITGDVPCEEKTILCVNGALFIHPKTEEILKSFFHIIVNGQVSCPSSMSGFINGISVNGSVEYYPDNYTIMTRKWEMDRYFPILAKEGGKYFSSKSIEIIDTAVDTTLLVKKGVNFKTKELYVLEEKLKDCMELFNEDVTVQVIPTGYSFIKEDIMFCKETLLKYGNYLYVKGDLLFGAEDKESLKQIEGLYVKGTLYLSEEQFKELNQKNLSYEKVEIIKENAQWKKNKVVVDAEMLSKSKEGISLISCSIVEIAEDVSEQEIKEKVSLINCALVRCNKKQHGAVELVGRKIAKIAYDKEEKEGKETVRVINAEQYIL